MATKTMWRLLTVMSATVFALAIAASAFAQVPQPPHTFYGSGATLDGASAEGTVTATNQDGEAVGSGPVSMGSWTIDVDPSDAASVTFSIDGSDPSDSYDVSSGSATDVSLALSSPAPADDGEGDAGEGDDTGDTGDGDADDMGDTGDGDADDMGDTGDGDADDMGDTGDGDADDMGDDPMALPDTGSGGLAGGSSLPVLPLAVAISIAVALGGVLAVRRTRA